MGIAAVPPSGTGAGPAGGGGGGGAGSGGIGGGSGTATLSRELGDFLVELSIAFHKHAIYPAALQRVLHEPWRIVGRRVVFAA